MVSFSGQPCIYRDDGYTAEKPWARHRGCSGQAGTTRTFIGDVENHPLHGRLQGEVWDRRKNGEIYPVWVTIAAVKSDGGTVTHYVSTHTDITERKVAEDEITRLAFYDPLTQLPNRRLLLDRLQQGLASSARSGRNGR